MKNIPKNILHYYVDLLRIRDDEYRNLELTTSCINTLHNIIRTMRQTRHDVICGENFSYLDFGNITLNDIDWSDDGNNPCCFDNCIINEWNFMSGHNSKITKLIFADDCIISGDINGIVIVWDLFSGLMKYRFELGAGRVQFLLCYKNILIATSNAGKISSFDLNTGHELYHFHTDSQINACIIAESHKFVIMHVSSYYTQKTPKNKIKSCFIVFDLFSGTFCSNEIPSDDIDFIKIITNNQGYAMAMSEKSVVSFNYMSDNTCKEVVKFSLKSPNSILDIVVDKNGDSGMVLVEGALNATSIMWNRDNHKPNFIIYHSFTNPERSYIKYPIIKNGWIDWGDEEGFGVDFDGEWCVRTEDGNDWICEEDDAFNDVYLSENGDSYIIAKKTGYELYKAKNQEIICSLTHDELKALFFNSNKSDNENIVFQDVCAHHQLLIDILYEFTHFYPEKIFINSLKRKYYLYDGSQMLIETSPSIPSETRPIRLKPHSSIALSSNIEYAVTGDIHGNLTVYNLQDENIIRSFYGCYKFSADKTIVLQDFYCACYGNHFFVWDSCLKLKYVHVFGENLVHSYALSELNLCVIITESDTIYLWDIKNEVAFQIYEPQSQITASVVLEQQNSIIYALDTGLCVCLDLLNGKKIECQYPMPFAKRVITEVLPTTDGSVVLLHNGDIAIVCWNIIENRMYKLPPHTSFVNKIYVNGTKCSGNGIDFFDLVDIIDDNNINWEWISIEKVNQKHKTFKRLYPLTNLHIKNCFFNHAKCSPVVKQILYQQNAIIDNQETGCGELNDITVELSELYREFKERFASLFDDNGD